MHVKIVNHRHTQTNTKNNDVKQKTSDGISSKCYAITLLDIYDTACKLSFKKSLILKRL